MLNNANTHINQRVKGVMKKSEIHKGDLVVMNTNIDATLYRVGTFKGLRVELLPFLTEQRGVFWDVSFLLKASPEQCAKIY